MLHLAIEPTPIDTSSGDHVNDLLASNPGLRYDEDIFIATCRDLGQSTESEYWSRHLNPLFSAREMVAAVPDGLRAHFLAIYIGHSKNRFEI